MTKPVLRGSRCQCAACEQYFSCAAAFDRHRVGDFAGVGGINTRRCLLVEEMLAQGWAQNERGFWRRPSLRAVHSALGGDFPERGGDCRRHEEGRP